MNTAILRATVCDQYSFFRPQSKTLPIIGLVKAFTRYGVQTIVAFYITDCKYLMEKKQLKFINYTLRIENSAE